MTILKGQMCVRVQQHTTGSSGLAGNRFTLPSSMASGDVIGTRSVEPPTLRRRGDDTTTRGEVGEEELAKSNRFAVSRARNGGCSEDRVVLSRSRLVSRASTYPGQRREHLSVRTLVNQKAHEDARGEGRRNGSTGERERTLVLTDALCHGSTNLLIFGTLLRQSSGSRYLMLACSR